MNPRVKLSYCRCNFLLWSPRTTNQIREPPRAHASPHFPSLPPSLPSLRFLPFHSKQAKPRPLPSVGSASHRMAPLSAGAAAAVWAAVRARAVAPALTAAVWACLAMSAMLLLEAACMSLVSLVAVRLLRLRPERRFKWEPMTGALEGGEADVEDPAGRREFPMVLVQIPMYNEKEVYKLSIGAVCALTWPPDRIIIQVLDDSTDPIIKELVELECQEWASKKIDIKYEVRNNRKGYKAGALKKGMEHVYAQQCEFVAIFDADFQPESDFLLKTIPFLVHNPKIALVQTRWKFVNYDACLMTRIQKMSLDYHFKVEGRNQAHLCMLSLVSMVQLVCGVYLLLMSQEDGKIAPLWRTWTWLYGHVSRNGNSCM
ncbi:hypothetical protein ACQJBY_038545 [Aegilops geniculata]